MRNLQSDNIMDKNQKQARAIEIVTKAVEYDMKLDYMNAINSYNAAVSLLSEVLKGRIRN